MKILKFKYCAIYSLFLLINCFLTIEKPLYGQIVQKNSIQLAQGNFNLVIQKSDLRQLNSNDWLMDTIFRICHSTLIELESNFSYKLNDKIHFIIFCDLNEYVKFKQSALEVKNPENTILCELFITGEIQNIKSQIRYVVAEQFLKEYLLGLSFKEKFDTEYSDKTPDWLIRGFQKYYAYGIQIKDFQNFKSLMENGAFKNINFIKPEHQEIFGSVIWYMLEKEKGSGINGIFWPLIRYATSFERTFKIYFNQSFKQWLKNKVIEISDFSTNKVKFNDHEIPIKNGSNLGLELHYSDNFETGILVSEFVGFYKITIKKLDKTFIGKYPKIGQTLLYSFNKPSSTVIQLNGASMSLLCVYKLESGWTLIFDTTEVFLGNLGQYTIMENHNDTTYLLHEYLGRTEVIKHFNGNILYDENLKFLSSSYSDKVLGLKKTGNIWFKLYVETKLSSDSSALIIDKLQFSKPVERVYIQKFNHLEITSKQLILENETKINMVLSSPIQQSTLHLENRNGKWKARSTEAKGIHFGQYNNPNSNKYYEYYISSRKICINGFDTNQEFHSIDTLIAKRFLFDSLNNIKKSIPIDTAPKYDSGRFFLSNFPENSLNNQPLNFSKYQNIKYKTKTSDFKNWYYFRTSKIYLSNKEIGSAYNVNVPNSNFYNSLFTLFYEAQISSSNNRHWIDLLFFSNLNRRRVGFQMNQSFYIGQYLSNFGIDYRIRQIGSLNNQLLRNKSVGIEQFLFKTNRKIKTGIGFKYLMDQVIPLNTTFDHLVDKVSSQHFTSIILSTEIKNKNAVSTGVEYAMNIGIEPGIFIKSNTLKWNNYFHMTGNLNYQFGYFTLKGKLDAKYGVSKVGVLYSIGGSNGWLNENQFNTENWSMINKTTSPLQKQGGFIRGALNGDRIGNSFVCGQIEIHLNPLRLIKSYFIESVFLKNLTIYGLFDFGTAFTGNSPRNLENPYKLKTINNPNYTLTVKSYQNPYVYSGGYGMQFKVIGYTIRLENAWAKVGNDINRSILLVSFGKNF